MKYLVEITVLKVSY